MKDKMDERRKSEKWWKKKGETKKPTEKQRKNVFSGCLFFCDKKCEERKDQQGISRRVSK